MWLLVLVLLLHACSLGLASECIDHTLRCTHRRVPFPTRKDLPETLEALDKICRDQNEYYDCLQNIPGDKNDGDAPPSADKLNRLDAEYMLSELCTEGLKTRSNYLKQAVCINKQKTDVCVSPEFLIILLGNENSPSRCSIQNKVTSCVSMMLAMNCGAEAGFLYRRLLHIAYDGDIHCNAGEDLGEVFSLFKLSEENENKESDKFDDRFGEEVSNEESSEEIFFHRFGEIPENVDSESASDTESTTNAVSDYEHVSEKPFEADNLTFQNDGWNGMEFREDWALKTVYGRSLPGNSNTEISQDFPHFVESGLGQKICSLFEVDNKQQTNLNEHCFDQMLENIVEKQDQIHESKQDVHMKSDADVEMNVLETASITEMYTNPSDRDEKSEFQSGSLITDVTSTNLPSLENAHIGFSELSTSETVDEPRPLKDYEPSFYEQSIGKDLVNENSYIPVDMIYPHGHPAQQINEKSSGSEVEFSTIDKIGSMDSIGRNIYTITDAFDYIRNPDASIAFEDTYLVDEESIAPVGEQDSDFKDITKSHFENEALEEPHTSQATLKEIVKRLGEIEVATPLLDPHQFGTDKTIENTEILTAKDVSESTQYNALPESNQNEPQRDFPSAEEHLIEYADSSEAFSRENYEMENPGREMRESKKNGSHMVQNIFYSEAFENHPIQDEESASTSIEFKNIEDLDSVSQEDDKIQHFDDLEQTSNPKLKYAYFITDDIKAPELVEDFEISKDSVLDEIGSAATFMYESGSENSSFPYTDPNQDLNNYESSSESLGDIEGQYVTLQEYNTPFVEKDVELEDDESSKDLKYSNEGSYFSSIEIENMEGSGLDEFPEVVTENKHASEFYESDDSLNELKLIDMNEVQYSGSSDYDFLQSGLEELKVTMGDLEGNENHGLEETETSTDQMIEILEDAEPDVQNRIEFKYNQPIVIKMSDEDIRNYYELNPHEPQNHLLLTDVERAKFDPSESEFVKEHSSKFQMQDVSDSDVREVDGENEQVILESEKIYLGNTENELLNELNSYLKSSIEDVPEEGHVSGDESVKDSSRRSLEMETPASTYLNADLTLSKETSSPLEVNEAFETSTTHSPILESLREDDDALDIFETADLTMHDQYLASEDVTSQKDEYYSGVQNTEMAYSDFDPSIEDPEKIIMNHLDRLLQNDAVDYSSEDSTIEDDSEDEMNEEKMGVESEESVKEATDDSILIDQMNEEQIECHTDKCQQLLLNQFADETVEQEHDAFRIKTNKIKTVTPYLEDFLAERLSSNKVYSGDSILALVSENDSQVSESDVEQRIPCLHFFSLKDDTKRFGCFVYDSGPTYVIY